MSRSSFIAVLAVILIGNLFFSGCADKSEAGTKREFARTTIDVGIVVSDVKKAADFYKNALGFTEVSGFDVSAEMGGGSGLTDNQPFKVRVFVLGDESTATKIKLMEFPQVQGKKVDHRFIHSSLGYSYLTIFVSDMTASVARAKKAGAVIVKKPYQLGGNNYLTLVKDPDGNIVEFVGPAKSG
ncbi:MAG: VOC family protein [Planctomycetota bacterium]|jgi:catechol 2,3-dioxygenase-like lactoylglutathione lyase family enzyme